MPQKILYIGFGNMAQALCRGQDQALQTLAYDPHAKSHMLNLRDGDKLFKTPEHLHDFLQSDQHDLSAIIFAVKPQIWPDLKNELDFLESFISDGTVTLSIMAGVPLQSLTDFIGGEHLCVRLMPNTPVSVGAGSIVAVANHPLTKDAQTAISSTWPELKNFYWLKHDQEDLMSVVTALSGSGPGYLFYLCECLAKAAEDLGLDKELSTQLARDVIHGTGQMLVHNDDQSACKLRQAVTSKGGTTAAGLDALINEDALQNLIKETLTAARDRSDELASSKK